MSTEPLALSPAHRVDPSRFADAQHDMFTGMNLRIGTSTTTHATAWRDWFNGLTLPAPACRQGWSGLGAAGELRATTHPVTCRKCARLLGSHQPDHGQGMLFELP